MDRAPLRIDLCTRRRTIYNLSQASRDLLAGAHIREQLPPGYWACIGAGSRVYARTIEEEFLRREEMAVAEMRAAGAEFALPNLDAYRQASSRVIEERVRAGEISEELIERIDALE